MKILSAIFDEGRKRGGLKCLDKSRTQQSMTAESDINNIIKRFEKTGLITNVNQRIAQYGDFSNVPDYQTALETVKKATLAFNSLPAFIRERFNNDPAAIIEFLKDPQNRKEAISLGLLEPENEKTGESTSPEKTPPETPAKPA